MNIMRSLKILLVGDTRVKTLIREKDQNRIDIKIYPVEGGQYTHVVREINEQLAKEFFNLLIIVTLQNDMTILKGLGLKKDIYMQINKEFDVDYLMEMICDEDLKWHERYPDLYVVWVIPAVPNFIRYNECFRGKRLIARDVVDVLSDDQKLYERYIEKLVEKFREKNLAYIDVNKLTRFRGKRRQEEKCNRGNPMLRTWIDPVMTIDGLHPQTRMAERFLRMLSQLVKSIMKRRKEKLKAELLQTSQHTSHMPVYYETVSEPIYPLSDPFVITNSDASNTYYNSCEIDDLRNTHLREWEPYRLNPHLHPDYITAKSSWQNDIRFQGVIFKKYSELETHWWDFWLQKIKAMYTKSWEEKLVQYYSGKSTHSQKLSLSAFLSSVSFDHSDSELRHSEHPKRKRLKSVNNSVIRNEKRLCESPNITELGCSRSSSRSSLTSNPFESDWELQEKTKLKKEIQEKFKSNKSPQKRPKLQKDRDNVRKHQTQDHHYSDRSSLESDSADSVYNSSRKEKRTFDSKYNKGKRRKFHHPNNVEQIDLVLERKLESLETEKDLDRSLSCALAHQNNTLLDLTSSLCKISGQLGALGIPLSALHYRVKDYAKKGFNSFECVDDDAKLLLEFIGDKIEKIMAEDANLFNKNLVLEASKWLTPFLKSFHGEETDFHFEMGNFYGLEIFSLINATRGMHKTEIIAFVRTLLSYKGYRDVSDIYLNRIYLEIKHHEIEIET